MKLLGRVPFKEFRNRALVRLTAWAVRGLLGTVRYRVQGWEPAKLIGRHGKGAIVALWHNSIMLPLGHESRRESLGLISPGRDGEFAARVMRRFGVEAVRGSTSRDAVRAVRRIVTGAPPGTILALTPDGPRGPRYRVQPGAAWIASRTGWPIVPLGVALTRTWKLRSWDRFRIPKPFARAHLLFGAPVYVPSALDRAGLEEARARLERELHQLSKEAAHLAGCAWPD